jgi:hypothetical protein
LSIQRAPTDIFKHIDSLTSPNLNPTSQFSPDTITNPKPSVMDKPQSYRPNPAQDLSRPQITQSSSVFNTEPPPQEIMQTTPNEVTQTSGMIEPQKQDLYDQFGGNNPDDPGDDSQLSTENSTEQGRKYDENVLKAMDGEGADVASARNSAKRDNRFQSYYDDKTIKETLAQSGLEPGTIEYQRALDRTRSGTNQANLQRDNNVNQLQRDYFNDAMNKASGVESKIRGYETEKFYDNKSDKLMDKQDVDSFINDQPQKIQNALRQIQMSGGDVQSAIQEMYDNGTIKEDYRPQDQYENLMDESSSYYQQIVPKGPNETDEQYQARPFDSNGDGQITSEDQTIGEAIYDRFKNLDETQRDPINDATGDRTAQTEADARIDSFITNGGDLSSSDWESLQNDATKMEALRSSDNFVDWNQDGKGENTGSDWEVGYHKIEDIEASWQKNNPLGRPEAEGMIIEKDGELYKITNPMHHGKHGPNINRVEILMEPVGGGAEVVLMGSEGWRTA